MPKNDDGSVADEVPSHRVLAESLAAINVDSAALEALQYPTVEIPPELADAFAQQTDSAQGLAEAGKAISEAQDRLLAEIPTDALNVVVSTLAAALTAPPGVIEKSLAANPQETEAWQIAERAERRRRIIDPILEGKGLSVYRWEKEAKVASKVGQRWLDGKTKRLRREQHNKLARVLGLDKLPA